MTITDSAASCLFCRIVAGEIPSRQVYADQHAVAFLDIGPWQRGHSLVVPRRHVPDLLTGAPALTEIAPTVDTVSRLLVDRLGADGLNLVSSAGAAAGQVVFHLHVHLVPRYAAAPGLGRLVEPTSASDAELDAVLAQIRGA
ncbi:MAG TPA: HIT domain-containing protein [Propionibacteriaceae bacterium]|jgi:histidine triad (HIT) family protein